MQFIVHESKEKLLESVAHFDLIPCRNLFNMTNGLRIFGLEDITLERTTVNTFDLFMRLRHLISVRSLLKDLYQRNVDRIVKYRKRGFDIALTIPDEDTLKSSIVFLEDRLLHKTESLFGMFQIMGIHNPASCVRTADCRCKSVDDQKGVFCWENFRCGCDHHVQFRQEALKRYEKQQRDYFAKEHIEFWSAQTK
jgi:hypothetical protein